MVLKTFEEMSIEEVKEYYIKNISKSEKLRCEISLSNDLREILYKSLLCIYVLTEDIAFYETNIKKLKCKS